MLVGSGCRSDIAPEYTCIQPTPVCIQPSDVVVHVVHGEAQLLDLAVVRARPVSLVVESGSGIGRVKLVRDESRKTLKCRLQIPRGTRVRLLCGNTPISEWFDPWAIAQVPAPEAIQTPAWALGAVWYNIFPERFDNANPGNDSPGFAGTMVPWTSAWDRVSPDEIESSWNRARADPVFFADHPARAEAPWGDVVFERRYGGDLQGVVRRLDHIVDMGATAIWLCPIFRSTSLHKYDAADHRHVDPMLGSPTVPGPAPAFTADPETWGWTPADRYFLETLLPAVRTHDLRLILDGVWNHVGIDHPAFSDARMRGHESPFSAWFELIFDQSRSPSPVIGWRSWGGRNGRLPVLRHTDDGDLAEPVAEHIFNITTRWMDPDGDGNHADGIDGWRLDVANEIGMHFWSRWRAHVRKVNPEAVLIGELWHDGSPYFGGRAFDAQMNYPFAYAVTAWLGRDPTYTSNQLRNDLLALYTHHPATDLAQMNLIGSHDTARAVSMLANPGFEYDRTSDSFDTSQPEDESYDRLVLAAVIQTVAPGSPMIYAGDELGMFGGDDPANRKPLPWTRAPKPELAERLARWYRLRTDKELGLPLRFGMVRFPINPDPDIFIIERRLNSQIVQVWINRADRARELGGVGLGPVRIAPRAAIVLVGDAGSPALKPWRPYHSKELPKSNDTIRP